MVFVVERTLQTKELGKSGLKVSRVGLGCAPLGNLYAEMSQQQARALLDSANASGIHFFDTAPHYGQGLSERRLGDALRDVDPASYVLSTKVGRLLIPAPPTQERHGFRSPMPFDFRYDYTYDGIMRSLEDSLQRLGLARVDVLLMHDIGRQTHGKAHDQYWQQATAQGGFKALQSLREQRVVSAIGLGVNEAQVCMDAFDLADWDCFLLAGRYTLLEQHTAANLLDRCSDHQRSIILGGPFNSGILATGAIVGARYNYDLAPPEIMQRVEAIQGVCEQFSVPMSAAALQFPLAHPAIASVIPGADSEARLSELIQHVQQAIPQEFWTSLKQKQLIEAHLPVPVHE